MSTKSRMKFNSAVAGQMVYGVIILGSGPAGLQAAIHAARAKVSVLVMGKPAKSSLHRAHIENYCCMERTAGEDLLQQGIQQAEAAGTSFMYEDVLKVSQQDQWLVVQNESGEDLWPWGFPAINSEYREKKNCWGVE